jgi:phytoene dehydrogenase-like protein
MAYEVVVVGGGIGGLTAAALLAARGINVCLLERESRVGGCAASFEKFGYSFEQGNGLYAGWEEGGLHRRVFSELPVDPPETRFLEPAYVVRLPDQTDIAVARDSEKFENNLKLAFPECAEQAINFYHHILQSSPDTPELGRSSLDHPQPLSQLLEGTSDRFRSFLDAQLETLGQTNTSESSQDFASWLLTLPSKGLSSICGGSSALADTLAKSITASGGKVRLNAPTLRLITNEDGRATGVVLLNGELVEATRAVISNLTIWDTYGKLLGLSNTPSAIRKVLAELTAPGAYLVYLGMSDSAAEQLPAEHVLAVAHSVGDSEPAQQLNLATAPHWDPRAPEGKRASTLHLSTDVEDWFTYHRDESEAEAKDQEMLEVVWQRLHKLFPGLGDEVEVIDTATPRTFYELTRRKLGMVNGVRQSRSVETVYAGYLTPCPNLFRVGDTTLPGPGILAATRSALDVARVLAPKP